MRLENGNRALWRGGRTCPNGACPSPSPSRNGLQARVRIRVFVGRQRTWQCEEAIGGLGFCGF